MTSNTNAAWLANAVFDGARAFEGVAPDLDLHCQRSIRSAEGLLMKPPVSADRVLALAREGIAMFPADAPLYIRPMFWAESGLVAIDPDSTQFALVITRMPLPDPTREFLKSLKPNVSFVVPASLHKLLSGNPKDLADGKGSTGNLTLGWICSFNLPVITLCAFIVLNIFLSLFDLIFGWMFSVKICIPFPKQKDGE